LGSPEARTSMSLAVLVATEIKIPLFDYLGFAYKVGKGDAFHAKPIISKTFSSITLYEGMKGKR